MVPLLVAFVRGACGWLLSGPFASKRGSDTPDLRCVSWILQKSLDKGVLQSTLEYLATMTVLAECNVGEAREKELASIFLEPALDEGVQVAHYHNIERTAHDVVRRTVGDHPVVPQIQREPVDEHNDVTSTIAGEANKEELAEEEELHEAGLKKVQEEMAPTSRERDEETGQVREDARMQEEHVKRVREDQERMALQRRHEMERAELGAKRLEERARIERQRAEVEHQRRLALRNGRFGAAATAAEAERREGDCVIM